MIRVGILRGGRSNEYELSLRSGENLLRNLNSPRYKPVDILVDRDGVWHLRGLPIDKSNLSKFVDVVWSMLHGGSGEDGRIAQELENLGIPYVGSGPFASALAINKRFAKDIALKNGIEILDDILIPSYTTQEVLGSRDYMHEASDFIFKTLPPPWIVKPVSGGGEIGVELAKTRNELVSILQERAEDKIDLLVEKFVSGKSVKVLVVDGFRGRDIYTFLPTAKDDLDNKIISPKQSEYLQKSAISMHKALGARHISESEFIVTKDKIYFLETNTVPKFFDGSTLARSLSPLGTNMSELIETILDLVSKR